MTDMKLKHKITVASESVDALFNLVAIPAVKTYTSTMEETAAMEQAKRDFESMLNDFVSQSFKIGKKVGGMWHHSPEMPMISPTM